ncbi:hypothetical protein ACQPU1_03615 [Clostridium paraputrificum]|uniref:hypothetical protein n=1 Tax=Clostridium TaxID=1485 RepID=UPI003D351653
MKKQRLIIILALIFCMFGNTTVNAKEKEQVEAPIVIDGLFEDWNDKPTISDSIGDTSDTNQDLKEIRYFTDDNYLYLYVERYKVGSGWDIWVPININNGYEQSVFFPWENNGKESWEWSERAVTTYKINASYEPWDNNSLRVNVFLNEANNSTPIYVGENQVFKNSDGTRFEVRLPLDKIGLAEKDSKFEFAIASATGQWSPTNIDWAPNNDFINITQGPIFGGLTPIIAVSCFLGVGLIAKKKKHIE